MSVICFVAEINKHCYGIVCCFTTGTFTSHFKQFLTKFHGKSCCATSPRSRTRKSSPWAKPSLILFFTENPFNANRDWTADSSVYRQDDWLESIDPEFKFDKSFNWNRVNSPHWTLKTRKGFKTYSKSHLFTTKNILELYRLLHQQGFYFFVPLLFHPRLWVMDQLAIKL